MTAFLHGFFKKVLHFVIRIAPMVGGGTTIQESLFLNGGEGGQKSINRNHYATEWTTSFKIVISRSVFEHDINSDCIFTRFFYKRLLYRSKERVSHHPFKYKALYRMAGRGYPTTQEKHSNGGGRGYLNIQEESMLNGIPKINDWEWWEDMVCNTIGNSTGIYTNNDIQTNCFLN